MADAVSNIETHPLHLGLGATAIAQPAFSGIDWYQGYGERHAGDGAQGRLVSMHSFAESWDSWAPKLIPLLARRDHQCRFPLGFAVEY